MQTRLHVYTSACNSATWHFNAASHLRWHLLYFIKIMKCFLCPHTPCSVFFCRYNDMQQHFLVLLMQMYSFTKTTTPTTYTKTYLNKQHQFVMQKFKILGNMLIASLAENQMRRSMPLSYLITTKATAFINRLEQLNSKTLNRGKQIAWLPFFTGVVCQTILGWEPLQDNQRSFQEGRAGLAASPVPSIYTKLSFNSHRSLHQKENVCM